MFRLHRPPWGRPALCRLQRCAQAVVQGLAGLWWQHWTLLRDNPAYAAAVAAAAAAAATQLSWKDLFAVMISAALAIWAAVHEAHHPRRPSSAPAMRDENVELWS